MQRGCKRYTGCLSRCSLSPFSKAMPLPDTMFCAQQIDIAQELPDILKNFTKAAVRTQPEDLLLWSAAYFTALSKGERLPVKDRLELNVTHKTDSAMTPGLLKTLHKQLSIRETCSEEELREKWRGLCLPTDQLETLLSLGSFGSDIDWMEFFALGCSSLGEGAPMRDDKTAGLHPFGGYEPNCFLSFKLFHKKPHQELIQNDEGQK
ncbi:ropporin-1-like protein isoform X3 [Gasterosteus aculeatus]